MGRYQALLQMGIPVSSKGEILVLDHTVGWLVTDPGAGRLPEDPPASLCQLDPPSLLILTDQPFVLALILSPLPSSFSSPLSFFLYVPYSLAITSPLVCTQNHLLCLWDLTLALCPIVYRAPQGHGCFSVGTDMLRSHLKASAYRGHESLPVPTKELSPVTVHNHYASTVF